MRSTGGVLHADCGLFTDYKENTRRLELGRRYLFALFAALLAASGNRLSHPLSVYAEGGRTGISPIPVAHCACYPEFQKR